MNIASTAFDEYSWDSGLMSSDYSISCEYCLEDKAILSENNTSDPYEVTSISWSSNGSSIAISYGTTKDIPWGQNRSYLAVWNIDRPRMNVSKCDHKIELDSSAQVIRFHPKEVGIIACGLYSGVLLLWRLSDDSVLYANENHEDPITEICWLTPQSSKYIELATTSTDGYIAMWSQKISSRTQQLLKLVKKMAVKSHRIKSRSSTKGSGVSGITCCTIRQSNQFIGGDYINTLLIGCGNGGVAKCVVEDNPTLSDPVVFSYEGHLGPVYSIDWSPYHRHIFLTCSTDYTCRLFHALQANALSEFSPFSSLEQTVLSCKWSPMRAMTIFAIGGSGLLASCNVKTKKSISTNSDYDPQLPYTCLQMHNKRAYYIATGNSNGSVHIWRLGTFFTQDSKPEENDLKLLAEQALTDDD